MPIKDIRFRRHGKLGNKRTTSHEYRQSAGTMAVVDVREPEKMYINKHYSDRDLEKEITHEEIHHTVNKLVGKEASGMLDNTEPFSATWDSCVNCGRSSSHHHGPHGCCNRLACHTAISLAHLRGEKNVNRSLRNPYRLW